MPSLRDEKTRVVLDIEKGNRETLPYSRFKVMDHLQLYVTDIDSGGEVHGPMDNRHSTSLAKVQRHGYGYGVHRESRWDAHSEGWSLYLQLCILLHTTKDNLLVYL
ncbi:hypothetical protein Ciccas_001290 [Cichlidogyrus casuarinus]|uniref:Uncharacterized protein n=1 Tax=Cichlidogyrus casuarinus TaxID=1844966 RepID=A0ABD2QKL4_9PLAT